jgi:hypothetical protein
MMGTLPLLFFFQRCMRAAAFLALRLDLIVGWLWRFLQVLLRKQAVF